MTHLVNIRAELAHFLNLVFDDFPHHHRVGRVACLSVSDHRGDAAQPPLLLHTLCPGSKFVDREAQSFAHLRVRCGLDRQVLLEFPNDADVELGQRGRCLPVHGGGFFSPRSLSPEIETDTDPEDLVGAARAVWPLGRPGRPEDIAQVVLFLASDLAEYVTSQVIAVDGGVMATYPLGQGRRLTAEPQQN
ncbi:MAG: SDR family oxidoreductase [Chloroflexi bacterium]|nr:SDR family oxidoreductase [Chloroflexota bacterium]